MPLIETNPHIQQDLYLLNEAVNYRRWIFSLIKPYLGDCILEVGAGIGNYTEQLLGRKKVWTSDYDPAYVEQLKTKFANRPEVCTMELDISNISTDKQKLFRDEMLDTILLLNVLEHVDQDLQALHNLKECLRYSGRILIVVPALQQLFGSLDVVYGHYRRYNRQDFYRFQEHLNMKLKICRHFNFLGILGWWLNAKVMKRDFLPGRQIQLFNKIVPLIRSLERPFPLPIGLSLYGVFSK